MGEVISYDNAPYEFPANIAWVLSAGLSRLPCIDVVLRRPLRAADPNRSAAVVTMDWTPGQYEIGMEEPALAVYDFRIQYMVKMAGNEAEAMAQHSVGSKMVRAMLYRDGEFGVQLRSLSETFMGREERVKKFKVNAQRFVSNEIQGTFLHISSIDFRVDVETV